MRLRMRLILSYTVLAVAASIILGIIYNNYIGQKYKSTIFGNLQFLSERMVNQFDNAENSMEQVSEFILSDQDTLSAIRTLSTEMGKDKPDQVKISDNQGKIRRSINTAYNLDNFYRVILFNQYGYIASSANKRDQLVNQKKDPLDISWLPSVQNTKGKFVLLGIHKDDWGLKEEPEELYSVVKEIQGNHLGYIEIQRTTDTLKKIFQSSSMPVNVIAAKATNNQIIYKAKDLSYAEYQSYFQLKDGVYKQRNAANGKEEVIVLQHSKNTDMRILLVEDWKTAMIDFPNGSFLTAVIVGIFFVVSLIFIIFMATLLTKPIRQLRERIEHTDLSNLNQKIEIDSSDSDFQALTSSYRDLLQRLDNSMTQEKRLALLQLQAQYDTLQAQVNPHFIYNVLNVISGRGIQNDDEKICEMCANLAAIMRYSTNTKERYANVSDELDYLKNYVYLLEARYVDRLNVHLEIEKDIYKEILPKITLQQLVENSIDHGFCNHAGEMNIVVKSHFYPEWWGIEVIDNGEGITQEDLKAVAHKINQIRKKLSNHKELIEMEIGGMGLANTYGRLYLLYQDDVIFEIENRTDGQGTRAIVGVKRSRG